MAVAEILIGLLVTAGLFTRIAAAAGMGLNFLLFLTASWHTTPYFLGPDLVFTFAWLPFVLAGASGQPALDNVTMRPSPALARRTHLRPVEAGEEVAVTSTRRALLAEFAGLAVALAGIAALAKGTPAAHPRALASGIWRRCLEARAAPPATAAARRSSGGSPCPSGRRQARSRPAPAQRPGGHL